MNPFEVEGTEFKAWYDSRPKWVQDLIETLPPWYSYKITKTGQDCEIHSYGENGTVSVNTDDKLGETYKVFGLKPEHLTRGEHLFEDGLWPDM